VNKPITRARGHIRAALIAASTAFLVLLAAPAASAHATLLFATPAVQGAVPTAPTSLALVFDEPVTLTPRTLTLARPGAGQADALGPVSRLQGGAELTARIEKHLPVGVYTVTWEVIAEDGDDVTGTYQFAIGPAAGLSSVAGTASRATPGQARWVLFAALAVLLGELWGRRITRRPPPWARLAALLGLIAAGVLVGLQVGSGSLISALSHPDTSAFGSRPGILALIEVGAFAVAVVAARRARLLAAVCAAVIVAEALRAHPDNYSPTFGALVTVVHLTAAGLWVGGLLFVIRARHERAGHPQAQQAVTRRYARVALWLLAVVIVSGTVSTLIVLPLSRILTTGYGQLLIAKLALVAVATALALHGRLNLTRDRTGSLTRSTRAESVALVAVLALAAALTTAPPARTTSSALPFAPPATGNVVPLGSRAGQIGIYAEASAGQLVVRLSAPDADGDAQAPAAGSPGVIITQGGAATSYQLSATLADPAGGESSLGLTGCGDGCFVAQHLTWKTGTSQVTLHVAASTAHGGTVTLSVPWPARPDQAALTRTVAAMRKVTAFTLNEQATSDAAAPTPAATSLPMSGAALLSSDPYGTGQASSIDALALPGGTTELLLGYGSQQVAIQLVVAADGQIERETLASPDELIYRALRYPEH
jgi:copper transport protein